MIAGGCDDEDDAPRAAADDDNDVVAGAVPNKGLAPADEEGLPNPNPTGFPRLPLLPDPVVLPNPVKSGAVAEPVVAVLLLPSVSAGGDALMAELVLVPPKRPPVLFEVKAAGLGKADGLEPKMFDVELLDVAFSVSDFVAGGNKLLPNTDGVEVEDEPNGPLDVDEPPEEPNANGEVDDDCAAGGPPNMNGDFGAVPLSVEAVGAGGGNVNGLELLLEVLVGLNVKPPPPPPAEGDELEVDVAEAAVEANPPNPEKLAGGAGIEGGGFVAAGADPVVPLDVFPLLIAFIATSCFFFSFSRMAL